MQLKKYRMEKFIFHVKMFLDKKDTETARLIRKWIMDAKRNDGKIFDAFGIERNFSLYTPSFHPTFLRATAYVVCSFVKNRTRSFAWKFNQTSLPDEIYLFLAIQLFLTCMCTCSSRTIQLCRATSLIYKRNTWRGIAFWYHGKHNDFKKFPCFHANLFLYFVIRCSLNSKSRIGCQVYRYLYERVVLATLRIRLTNVYTIFVK